MFNQSPFRASKSRLTAQEENYLRINEEILTYVSGLNTPQNAEEIWLALKSGGLVLSIATFYTRLKKLVDSGNVEKIYLGYNKYVYTIIVNKN